MSTSSLIGIKNSSGITFVYCRFDGYLEGVGATLVDAYDIEDKINALLEHGDMSSLDKSIEGCAFYNEDDSQKVTIPDCEDVKGKYYNCGPGSWIDYVYLFENGKWYYSTIRVDCKDGDNFTYLPAQWRLVTEGLAEFENKN